MIENRAGRAIPARLNLAIGAALIAVNLLQLIVVPLLVAHASPAWGLLLVLPVLATPTLWAAIHEAVHGLLLPGRAWNDRLGRVLAGLFGAPFQILRLGHLMHHRFNRSPLNRPEVVSPGRPGPLRRGLYYVRLFFGLYLGELLASVLAILPDLFYRPIVRLTFGDEAPDGRTMWIAARRQLLEEPGRSRMRLDGALVTLGLVGAFWLYGEHWWMLALALGGRAFLVSFHDNAYHYACALDDPRAGHDLRVPAPLQALLMNFNHHRTHHARPSVPWTDLPRTQATLGHGYAGSLFARAVRQLAGPIPEARFRHPGAVGARDL